MSKKIEMNQLTFCIPIRVDSNYRLQNLITLLAFYSHHIRAHYIVLEADCIQRIKSLPRIDGLHYKFVVDTNPIFHRTYYINQMLKETTTSIAAIWDTDAIAPIHQLKQAYELLLENKITMVYPYDGRFWSINHFYSAIFRRKKQIKLFDSDSMPRILLGGYNSVGGAFLVNIQAYKRCGWENEHFLGWGPEDVERYHRLEILGEPPHRIKGSLYHLYHTRGINSGDFNQQLAISTKKEYIHVCSMYPDELRAYVDTWEWTRKEGI